MQIIAQTPTWSWGQSCGGYESGSMLIENGNAIVTDLFGNSYITGRFSDTATFGNNTIYSFGFNDIFLAKYDSSGNIVWVKNAGSNSNLNEFGSAITLDNFGNIYLTGMFQDTAHFDGLTLIDNGFENIFIAKYDTSGNVIWARKPGKARLGLTEGIGVDILGNYYIAGSLSDTAFFGTDTLICLGYNDIFIVKYDSSGSLVWYQKAGGNYSDQCVGMSFDNNSDIYITGRFEVAADFDGVVITGLGSSDIFTAKYDSAGNIIWAKGAGGGIYGNCGVGVSHDSIGNCYVTGRFNGSVAFGNFNLTAAVNKNEIFIAKYDTAGMIKWAKRAGGKMDDMARGLITDSNGNSYVTGAIYDTSSFDNFTLINSNFNVFVAKYDSAGNVTWVQHALGHGGLFGNGISLDGNGNPFVTGEYHDTVTFGNDMLISKGFRDVFVAKLNNDAFTGSVDFTDEDFIMEAYPNPVHSELHLTVKKDNMKRVSITIRNIIGQTYIDYEQINPGDEYEKIINFELLSPGIYLLDMYIDENRFIRKIVKN